VGIDIPKGTYEPTFHAQTVVESDRAALSSEIPDVSFEGSWPSVLARPFQNLTGDRERDYLGLGLATELAAEIARFQEIRGLLYRQEGYGKASSDYAARFVIEDNIHEDSTGIKVVVFLPSTIESGFGNSVFSLSPFERILHDKA
jgi:adenylate cyclase